MGRDVDREARLRVMEMLGHGREHVGTACLGTVARRRANANDARGRPAANTEDAP